MELLNYTVLLQYPNDTNPNKFRLLDGSGKVYYDAPTAKLEPALIPDENKTGVARPFNAFSAAGTAKVRNPFILYPLSLPLSLILCVSPSLPPPHPPSPLPYLQGPLVYVNYAQRGDFELLLNMSISVNGCVCIARYGEIFRGSKVRSAHSTHHMYISTLPLVEHFQFLCEYCSQFKVTSLNYGYVCGCICTWSLHERKHVCMYV